MVELADTLRSGRSARKGMEVRALSPAQNKNLRPRATYARVEVFSSPLSFRYTEDLFRDFHRRGKINIKINDKEDERYELYPKKTGKDTCLPRHSFMIKECPHGIRTSNSDERDYEIIHSRPPSSFFTASIYY